MGGSDLRGPDFGPDPQQTLRQHQQAFFHPDSSVLVGTYAVSILPAKERTAHTAEHAMEEPGKLRIDGLMVGISHAATLRLSQSHRYQPIPHERVNESWVTPICRPDLTEICLIHSRECAKCLN
jgi:hypothetical protein